MDNEWWMKVDGLSVYKESDLGGHLVSYNVPN